MRLADKMVTSWDVEEKSMGGAWSNGHATSSTEPQNRYCMAAASLLQFLLKWACETSKKGGRSMVFLLTYGGAIIFSLMPSLTGGSCAGSVNGRSFRTSTDGFCVSLRCSEIAAVINVGGKEIVVEQDRVLVNGEPKAKIPAKTKKIEVIDAHGTVNILADGASACKFKSVHRPRDLLEPSGERQVTYYGMEFVTPGRIVRMLTESESVQKAWKGDPWAKPHPTLSILGKTVVIEPKRLVVDGQPAITIPPNSRELKFIERSGRVNILADGVAIQQFTR